MSYKTLASKIVLNMVYSGGARVATLVMQLFSTIILTRILSPSDYGIVGFSMIFIELLFQFSDIGLSSASIQRESFDGKVRATAFTLKLGIGLGLLAIAAVAAPLASLSFSNPSVITVMRLLALSFVINSFGFLPNVTLTREMNSKALSFVSVVSSLSHYSLAVLLAWLGYGFWSIVLANVAASLVTASLLMKACPYKIQFGFDRAVAKSLLSFGASVSLSGFVGFLVFNLDNFLVGSVGGSTMLGYYALAFNWSALAATVLQTVAQGVLYPAYVKINSDRKTLRRAYLKTLGYISFAGVFALVALYCGSREFLIFLGKNTDKWLPALPALKILCLYGIARVLLDTASNVAYALNKPSIVLKGNLIAALSAVSLVYFALVKFGIEGVAFVMTAGYLLQYPLYGSFLKRELDISSKDLIRSVGAALASGAGILGLNFVLSGFPLPGNFTTLFLKTAILAFAYLMIYGVITQWKPYKELKEIFAGYRLKSSAVVLPS